MPFVEHRGCGLWSTIGQVMGSGLVSACPIEGATAQNLALAGLCTQNTPVLGAVASC